MKAAEGGKGGEREEGRGGDNEFFTIIEMEGGNLSAMMHQKHEDEKRCCKKKQSQAFLSGDH